MFFCLYNIAQTPDRFSSNPLPKLNVVTILMSESVEDANKITNELFREKFEIGMQNEILVDPTYKKLGEVKAFEFSLFGKSTSEKVFSSLTDSLLELNAKLTTLLIVDRQKKIRAFSQVIIMDIDNLAKVVEELLLNIDGKEIISVDSENPDEAFGWQTDLGMTNQIEKNKGKVIIDFGASKNYWYKLLGKEIPNVPLKKTDGTDSDLHSITSGKVSYIMIVTAPKDAMNSYSIGGVVQMLHQGNDFYRGFVLGESEPGDKNVENAKPDIK